MSARRLQYLLPAAVCPATVSQVFWPGFVAAPLSLLRISALHLPAQSAVHAAAASSKILKEKVKDLVAAGAVCLAVAVKAEAVAAVVADVGEAITGWAPSLRYPLIELLALLIMPSKALKMV